MDERGPVDTTPQRSSTLTNDEAIKAAQLIQRTYRGHRTRRQLNGFGLDATTKWYETVRDVRYKELTTPTSPIAGNRNNGAVAGEDATASPMSPARSRWSRATEIARRAGGDDHSPSESSVSSDENAEEHSLPNSPSREERQAAKRKRAEATELRKKNAKMMDLQYWLELVDQKHRYGSNLRKYHEYWRTQDTNQNFFYWLDEGDGKDVDLPERSRARLDSEQVRYLSREERLQYLVKINDEGLLVWAKNGELVWTKDELFRDSVNGIVPIDDSAPKWHYNVPPPGHDSSESVSSEELENSEDEHDNAEGDEGERYLNEEFHKARGLAKIKHVNTAVFFNHMVRTSLKKGHKWIFVADTSFRLYIGYKQSGAFQHSSFLHGARILSAGLIKVKHGQLRKLSPLSGHYRPRAANFRVFVHSLRDEGADLSRVSISQSYAVLVGLEAYTKARRQVKGAEAAVVHEKDKLLHPEKVKLEEEVKQDKSQSAEKERQHLAQQREDEEQAIRNRKARRSLTGSTNNTPGQDEKVKRVVGTGPEDGIPAPDGDRLDP